MAPTKPIIRGAPINPHYNDRFTVFGRLLLVQRSLDRGLRVEEAAHAAGISNRTTYKLLTRYSQEGPDGLDNCSSRPASCPRAIDNLRRQRISNCANSDRSIGTPANLWS